MARILWAIVLYCLAGAAAAERGSLFAAPSALPEALVAGAAPARALLPASAPGPREGSSLFAGTSGKSFFAPLPDRPRPGATDRGGGRAGPVPPLAGSSPAARLLSLIAAAEAGPMGYDAVQWGARVPPPAPPTRMTLGDIEAWTRATPGQPHAIGRYQFIPNTLKTLVAEAGLSKSDRFTPQVQDLLADLLLEDAGFTPFMKGKISRHRFMENLARIWAGLRSRPIAACNCSSSWSL